jgi:hypothetical protein
MSLGFGPQVAVHYACKRPTAQSVSPPESPLSFVAGKDVKKEQSRRHISELRNLEKQLAACG